MVWQRSHYISEVLLSTVYCICFGLYISRHFISDQRKNTQHKVLVSKKTTCQLKDVEDISCSLRLPQELVPQVSAIRRNRLAHQVSSLDDSIHDVNSIVPGTQSIFLKTFGCSHNISDSEVMCKKLSFVYLYVMQWDY